MAPDSISATLDREVDGVSSDVEVAADLPMSPMTPVRALEPVEPGSARAAASTSPDPAAVSPVSEAATPRTTLAECDLHARRPRRRWHGVTRPSETPVVTSAAAGDAVTQMALAVRNLTVSVNRFRAATADALEISPTDVLAMTEIAMAAQLTPGELATRIGVGVAGTSTVIDRLVRAGFVRRTPSALDRRTYLLALTPAGTHATGWIHDATRAVIVDASTGTSSLGSSTEQNSPVPGRTRVDAAPGPLASLPHALRPEHSSGDTGWTEPGRELASNPDAGLRATERFAIDHLTALAASYHRHAGTLTD